VAVGKARRVVVQEAGSPLPPVAPDSAWIYFGSDASGYFRVRTELAGRAREIPAGPHINAVADEFRDELLNFDEVLELRSELRWQATDLAERNPFSSNFVHACCCVLVLDRIIETTEGDLLVVVDDAFLGRRLAAHARSRGCEAVHAGRRVALLRMNLVASGLVHRLLFVGRWAAIRRAVGRMLDPERPVPPLDVVLVTWADPATFPPRTPVEHETYFGTLPAELRGQGRQIGFLTTLTTWVHPLDDIVRNLAAAADTVVVPEEALGLRDAMWIAVRTLRAPARVRDRFQVRDVDLSGLIVDELRREWAKPRQLWALQFFHVGRFLARHGQPAEVMFPFENQPWEKGLRLGLREALPAADSVGWQHTPISRRWFPYFPSRRDLAAGQLPERILTIGPLWRRLFEAHGYPPERLEVAPAYRYGDLAEPAVERVRAGEASVLVAGSIGRSDSLELVLKAVRALGPTALRLHIKLHPKLGVTKDAFVRDVLAALPAQALPESVSFVDGPVAGLLRAADVLVYNTTSVSYEALAAGLPIVFVASDFWFDVDPIPSEAVAGESARTPEELRAAVERALAESPEQAAARRERGRKLLAEAFAGVGGGYPGSSGAPAGREPES